ncbi:hypothetical protein SAMN06265337_0588 [Hymenobacter gelipurpurascens]|uniref:Uncharacterized protein n=1 Tax=Hymenobacter gelipurpurascens TaxID=89968 RepID=A0A212T7L0_9BACT|nr:hypothetical protein SAMN06265337_0588 [Hymenobacter gelipurpurascens]
MATCIIVFSGHFSQLLLDLEKALGIVLSWEEGLINPAGVTVYSFFDQETPSGPLRITGYTDHWLPEEFDLHITGSAEHHRLFCATLDAWPGSVLQRSNWV